MRTRILLASSAALTLGVLTTGCSSPPSVGGLDTDGLIATCLTTSKAIIDEEGSGDTLDGTVSSVKSEQDRVWITFGGASDGGEADSSACALTVGSDSVTAFEYADPSEVSGTEVKGAVDRWNDRHAEDWTSGEGPDPLEAPTPEIPHQSTY